MGLPCSAAGRERRSMSRCQTLACLVPRDAVPNTIHCRSRQGGVFLGSAKHAQRDEKHVASSSWCTRAIQEARHRTRRSSSDADTDIEGRRMPGDVWVDKCRVPRVHPNCGLRTALEHAWFAGAQLLLVPASQSRTPERHCGRSIAQATDGRGTYLLNHTLDARRKL